MKSCLCQLDILLKRSTICFIIAIIASCSAEKDKIIKPDQRSFLLVNLNQEFPVINFPLTFRNNDSLGLRCIKCELDPFGQKILKEEFSIKDTYFNSIKVSNKNKSILFHSLGSWASYSFNYDSIYRRLSGRVYSCYDWDISYSYKDSSDKIYQYSRVDDFKPDTTIYHLDSQGRVSTAEGTEYGDLYKSLYIKKVFYSGSGSIPDSIVSLFKREKIISERRKEIFYFADNKVDSMRIEADGYLSGLIIFVNRFDDKEMLVSRRIIWPAKQSETFVVEKLSK
ncbi:MAG: hypothetical protein J7604_25380 [Sporocytophaga sp.]|uniref:hypothetical protein n=1 Tax=Sporocytophaga sp. TaxID=2231183 RepID=UPI001B1D5998|nr:hypothetical protein [Sporocytophaga sp.]MBO9703566.1 hypothetical protein [Sporocytophaga sp.]